MHILWVNAPHPARQAAPYREDEVVLIVAGDHALAGAASVDRDALAGLPFVSLHRSSTVAAIRAELEAHGIDWKHLRVIMARARRAGRHGSPGRAPVLASARAMPEAPAALSTRQAGRRGASAQPRA
jgi:hypothetical protein